jgi:hypothetical protein
MRFRSVTVAPLTVGGSHEEVLLCLSRNSVSHPGFPLRCDQCAKPGFWPAAVGRFDGSIHTVVCHGRWGLDYHAHWMASAFPSRLAEPSGPCVSDCLLHQQAGTLYHGRRLLRRWWDLDFHWSHSWRSNPPPTNVPSANSRRSSANTKRHNMGRSLRRSARYFFTENKFKP